MESVIDRVGETVVSDVLQETVKELTGGSKRKWAVVLLALIVGGAITAVVIRIRTRRAAETAASNSADVTMPSSEEQA